MIEREVRLSAGEQFELPELGGRFGDVVVTAAPRQDQHLSTVYWDSDDRRLARWGLSFRYRAGEGWTVKLPSGGSGPLLVRDEQRFEAGEERPPPGAVDLVRGYLRSAALSSQVRLRTIRRGVVLRDSAGALLADVVDDAVTVIDGPGAATGFRELNVEASPECPPRLVKAILRRLRAAGAGSPDPTAEYIRAIGGPEIVDAEIEPGAISRSASVGEVVTHAIVDGVLRLIRHDAAVRLDADPEGVHQARVATRRLRSDLRTFRAVLAPEGTAELRAGLGWLGGELGGARDADVLLERLSSRASSLPEASSKGAEDVVVALEQRRAEAHAALVEAIHSDRYVELLDRLVAAAQAPALDSRQARRRAAKALAPTVRRAWRALDDKVAALSDPPTDEELHAVRILAKRCRYAAEACSPALGKPTARLAGAARNLQDTLGELNDAVVAERWLLDWAAAGASPPGAFAAGELAALERDAARRARAEWPARWKQLAGRARVVHTR